MVYFVDGKPKRKGTKRWRRWRTYWKDLIAMGYAMTMEELVDTVIDSNMPDDYDGTFTQNQVEAGLLFTKILKRRIRCLERRST